MQISTPRIGHPFPTGDLFRQVRVRSFSDSGRKLLDYRIARAVPDPDNSPETSLCLLTLYMVTSPDGFIAASDGSMDWFEFTPPCDRGVEE